MTLTEEIKNLARVVGFELVGVTTAEPLEDADRLREWIDSGYHAGMQWMERQVEKRENPRNVVPDAQSIIVVAQNYYTAHQHSERPQYGKISRYAWGDDYHKIIEIRLKQLYEEIRKIAPEAEGRYYVDTGPVSEKSLAVRAGIGWQGKHGNIITREFGSWIFLGVLLLNLPLDADQPARDLCGDCTACIEACPTQAIPMPYVVDSNRCISYLTIEHRGELTPDFSQAQQGWVFGCDICQDVCPWNRFQQSTEDTRFAPRVHNLQPKLADLINMSNDDFRNNYRHSPVKRAKWTGLVRNAESVLRGINQNCEKSI
jgi:epoxyqueuosine reductase